MADLIFFLEENGFHPRTEDLEAILRRCDHDSDRYLSFEEFCEVTEVPQEGPEVENDGMSQNNDAANMGSPERKEMQSSVKQS